MAVHQFTPRELCDLFAMLPPDHRKDFLERLGKIATPLDLVTIVDEMSPIHKKDFSDRTIAVTIRHMMPILVKQALSIVQSNPGLSNADYEKRLTEVAVRNIEDSAKMWAALEVERYKETRNPKVRNQERDNEIVRLRDEARKSFGEIGRELLRINPTWCDKGGKPMKRAAVEKAYHRRKENPTN